MKKQIESRAEVSLLVHTFYDRVRKDAELGSIFNSIITDWDEHLEKITDFWEQHLFGVHKYFGDPISAHNQVDETMDNTITAHNFGTWLHHWLNTLDELFEGKNVEVLKFKARKMQTVFYVNMVKNRS